jgi:predicted RNase H-like HicB family nuclease
MTPKRYAIALEATSTGFSAYAPDLPGVVAAAETADKTERLMREAVALYLEELAKDGQSAPEPVTRVEYVDA